MKKLLIVVILATNFISCSKSNVTPFNIEGTWNLQSLNFIIDGKQYTASKARLDITAWINVKWEFLPGGIYNQYFSTSKYKGSYTYDEKNSQVTVIDSNNSTNVYTLNNQSNNTCNFYSIEVADAQKSYSGASQEASILLDTVWFLNDQLTSTQIKSMKKVQMYYVFSK